MTDNPLATFPRTERTEIRLALSQYKGRRLIDLRLFFCNDAGEWLPSRKGCSLRPDELPDLLTALEHARREVNP